MAPVGRQRLTLSWRSQHLPFKSCPLLVTEKSWAESGVSTGFEQSLAAVTGPPSLPSSLASIHIMPSSASTGCGVIFRGPSWLWLCCDDLAIADAKMKACLNSPLESGGVYICPKLLPPRGSFKYHAKDLVSFIWIKFFIKIFENSYSYWYFEDLEESFHSYIVFPSPKVWLHIEPQQSF